MILASSSATRANLLRQAGISFEQIFMDYDEEKILKNNPLSYTFEVVNSKAKQFINKYNNYTDILFADSAVICDNKILTKPKDDNDAYNMLSLQSGNEVWVVSSMFYKSEFNFYNTSVCKIKFMEFNKDDLNNYIDNKLYLNKAGGMSIEGFNKKYIVSYIGNISTAMGLNVEILKAFLW